MTRDNRLYYPNPPHPWTEEDKKLVLENPEIPTQVLADKLGRTYQSVAQFRYRHKKPKLNTLDYDTRPSGWYGETVGKLLMEFPDAWESWLHYHRYVEYKEMGMNAQGWVMLLCRRDADAP